MEVLQLPSFDDLERDQRKLAFIADMAARALQYSRDALDRAEAEAEKEQEDYRWIVRAATLEAAVESLQRRLVTIIEEAKP